MASEVIWSNNKTMNFLVQEYAAARIVYPHSTDDVNEGKHWVQVHLKGSDSGLRYATCQSEQEAKECLVKLTEKLVLAGVIKVTEHESDNRFDRVELQEV